MQGPALSKIHIIERRTRINKIKQSVSNKNNIIANYPIPFEGGQIVIPVIKLPINFPIYNMNNGRTEDVQKIFLVENRGRRANFFSTGQENNSAQREQHKLLYIESKSSKADIHRELKKTKEYHPDKPILLTNDGIVINGNRRLSAAREIYYENVKNYSNFEYLPCAVFLNDLTIKQIAQIEDVLQVRKDLKQEYRWIALRLKIRREKILGFTDDEIAKNMGMKTSDIKKHLLSIDAIDEHLDKDLDEKGNYALVKFQEQIWNNLGNKLAVEAKGDQDKKDIVTNICRRIAFNKTIDNTSKHDVFEVLLHKKNIMRSAKKILKAHGKKVKIDDEERGALDDVGDEMTETANALVKIPIRHNKIIPNIFDDLVNEKSSNYVLDITNEIVRKLVRIYNKSVPSKQRRDIVNNLKKIKKKSGELYDRLQTKN